MREAEAEARNAEESKLKEMQSIIQNPGSGPPRGFGDQQNRPKKSDMGTALPSLTAREPRSKIKNKDTFTNLSPPRQSNGTTFPHTTR